MALFEGDPVRISYNLTDADDQPVDADVLALLLKRGSTVTDYVFGTDAEVTRVSQGVYRFESHELQAGFYTYSWQATGAVNDTYEDTFIILPKLRVS